MPSLHDLLKPDTPWGAAFYAVLALLLASFAALLIRRGALRIEHGLSNTTVLHFVSLFMQFLAYLVAFVLYAHLVPELRSIGTALLAGAGVTSIVVGLAAQETLGNLIAGFSLVLSGAVRVGDSIQLYCPVGAITADVKAISLSFTTLVDKDGHEVVVPNSVMMNSAIARIARGEHASTHPVAPATSTN